VPLELELPDTHEVSTVYYLVGPRGVLGFPGVTSAARFKDANQEEWGQSVLINHSRRSLKKLAMGLLMSIVRTGRPDKSAMVTQMKRPELVEAAYGCLWAAACKTHNPLLTDQELETMASTTIGRARNVREMRTERKSAAKSTKGTKATKSTKATTTERKPRADEYAGKKLRLTSEDKTNPRREGTHGFKSLEIIRSNPGILYETYLEKGGRRVDLKGSLNAKVPEVSLE
jgi:hypothetical protein